MEPIFAAAIVLAFVALGELVSIWTKARVPGLMVAMLAAFAFVQLGIIPPTLVDDSLMLQVYAIISAPLLFHMGTLIPLRTMARQWRSVVIAVAGMAMAVGLLAVTVGPLFGFETFIAGAGPLAGGIVATGLTTEGLTRAGVAASIVVLPALVLMLQSLPAMPITNALLRRYAIGLRDSGELEGIAAKNATATLQKIDDPHRGDSTRPTLVRLPKTLVENQLFMLFLVFVGGAAATGLSLLTTLPASLIALVLGILATAVGLSPERALEKASSFGIAMAAIVAVVIAPLLGASLSDVVAALLPTVCIVAIGAVGIMLGGFIATKLLGWRTPLGMSVALTAMYGFPADFLLTNEVARSVGRSDEERAQLLDAMLPPMLVGGFTSVSAGSVVIASVLVGFL